MTSPAEYEAALCQLEQYPPEVRLLNNNIAFERDLIIHFQKISKAAALQVRALLGGRRRAPET